LLNILFWHFFCITIAPTYFNAAARRRSGDVGVTANHYRGKSVKSGNHFPALAAWAIYA